jgi:hypothetical protein
MCPNILEIVDIISGRNEDLFISNVLSYLQSHKGQNVQSATQKNAETYMPRVGFGTTLQVFERPRTTLQTARSSRPVNTIQACLRENLKLIHKFEQFVRRAH